MGRLFSISCKWSGESRQLGAFFFVAKIDVGLERCFVSEEFVVISFVRAEGDVERRIEVHPRHVAVVVIIGQERIRASG